MQVVADGEELEESFHLDVLESPAGIRMADRILSSCAERILQNRLFSSIILTGRGFEHTDWAPEFMHQICSRRRVFVEKALFSKGALYKAEDYLLKKSAYSFGCICEGRLKTTVSVKIQKREKESQLVLAAAGDNWYEAKRTAEFLVSGSPELEFTMLSLDSQKKRVVKVPLEGFPRRPDRTTRIQLSVGFSNEKTMIVVIRDLGFGELFPATDTVIKWEVFL